MWFGGLGRLTLGRLVAGGGGGGPTPIYSDDFSSDTSGEWAPSGDVVDGVLSGAAGDLTYTIGAGDGSLPRHYREVGGLTIGVRIRVAGSVTGTASSFRGLRVSKTNNASSYYNTVSAGVPSVEIVPVATSIFLVLMAAGSVGQTIILDDVLVEIA